GGTGGGGDWPPPVRSLRHGKQNEEKLTGSAMCAEATDNIKNHTSVLPLTLTLYRREKELSGSCFRPLRLEINHTEQTFSRGETVANRLQKQ
ncbi:hypothetical protein ACP6ET_28555, partial [Klebsiella quasipneumoniae]